MLKSSFAIHCHRALCLATASMVALAPPAAHAMHVAPMVSELTTTGAGSAARIEVGNVGSVALPFETHITRLDFTENGEVVETPADEDFLVFPPQGLVSVGGRQVVRAQWVGEPKLEVSRAYYLAVSQLPVSTESTKFEGGGGLDLKVLYTMKALIVVAPPGAEPDVKVVSASQVAVAPPQAKIDPALTGGAAQEPPAEAFVPGVEITVTNLGKRYALMSGATWNLGGVDASGKPVMVQLTSADVSEAIGVGYVAPAGGKRTFRVPTMGVQFAKDKPIQVRFTR
jgi:fimbrial chaperone protein